MDSMTPAVYHLWEQGGNYLILLCRNAHGEMNSGVESLKRSLFSPLWEQVQRKRLRLDQLKFCWTQGSSCQDRSVQKATYAGRHDARSSSRRMLRPLTVGTLTTVTSYLRTENGRWNTDASTFVAYKRSSVVG